VKNTGLKIPEKDQTSVKVGFSDYLQARVLVVVFNVIELINRSTCIQCSRNFIQETVHVYVPHIFVKTPLMITFHFFPNFFFQNLACLEMRPTYTGVYSSFL